MYQAGVDPYCYPGTTILINKLDLKDASVLSDFELEVTSARLEAGVPRGAFDAKHFCDVHHHLFQDVYTWAGELRTIRIAKGDSMFCYPENIAAELNRIFGWLQQHHNLQGLDRESFAAQGAHFLAEINAIHTFREGNGRAQLSFMAALAAEAGHPFRLRVLNPKTFLQAMITSFGGDEEPLRQQLLQLIKPH